MDLVEIMAFICVCLIVLFFILTSFPKFCHQSPHLSHKAPRHQESSTKWRCRQFCNVGVLHIALSLWFSIVTA